MSDILAITDGVKAAYKQFMGSEGGKYLLQHLVNLEVAAQAKGSQAKTLEEKGLAMVELNCAYNLRSHLAEMSSPAPSQQRSTGSK